MPTAGLWNQPTFARLPTSKLTCQSAPKKAKVQKVVYVRCLVDKATLSIASNSPACNEIAG